MNVSIYNCIFNVFDEFITTHDKSQCEFSTVLCSSSGKSVNEREKDAGDKEEDEKKKRVRNPGTREREEREGLSKVTQDGPGGI